MIEGDCDLCGSRRADPMFVVDRFSRPFSVVRCSDCGLIYVHPQPDTAELAAYYDEGYYAGDAEFAFIDERQRSAATAVVHHARLRTMERYAPPGRLLDVGCAFGGLLGAARDRGWQPYGIEPSDYARRWAIDTMGLDVRAEELTAVDFPAGYFDAVTMIELVEHLAQPLASLRAARRLMRPGGLLVIQTSSSASVKARLSGRRWDYLLPGHLHYFAPATLRRVLAAAGFAVVAFYVGDELPLSAKLGYQIAARGRLGLRQRLAIAAKHVLRKVHLGDTTLAGGIVVYARAIETVA